MTTQARETSESGFWQDTATVLRQERDEWRERAGKAEAEVIRLKNVLGTIGTLAEQATGGKGAVCPMPWNPEPILDSPSFVTDPDGD